MQEEVTPKNKQYNPVDKLDEFPVTDRTHTMPLSGDSQEVTLSPTRRVTSSSRNEAKFTPGLGLLCENEADYSQTLTPGHFRLVYR